MCANYSIERRMKEVSSYEVFLCTRCLAHLAAMEGHLKCLQYLVSIGLSVTHVLNARNDQGETCRDVAALFSKQEVARYFSLQMSPYIL